MLGEITSRLSESGVNEGLLSNIVESFFKKKEKKNGVLMYQIMAKVAAFLFVLLVYIYCKLQKHNLVSHEKFKE